MLSKTYPLPFRFFTTHDNDPPTDPLNDPPADPPNDPPNDDPPEQETYTKEEMQDIINKERKRQEDKTRKTISELEQLKKSQGLSKQEKQNLVSQIEDLQNSLLTKEELSKKEREKLQKQHKETVESLTTERDQWQTKYQDSVILRSLTDAAAAEEAFNPAQIIALLKPNTRLVEDVDSDGKPTGKYEPKVKFQDDGVVLDLTVPEAVKRMKELPDLFGNLFKVNLAGGLGMSSGPGGSAPKDIKDMSPEEYRARGRKHLGLQK